MTLTPHEKRQLLERLDRVSVQRTNISTESRDAFITAREEEDLQAQIDIIWHILSGEQPQS